MPLFLLVFTLVATQKRKGSEIGGGFRARAADAARLRDPERRRAAIKVARKRSQAPEIIRARKLVRKSGPFRPGPSRPRSKGWRGRARYFAASEASRSRAPVAPTASARS